MYLENILFIASAIFTALTLFLAGYLLTSRRRSRVYTEALKRESEKFDALTSTSPMTQNRYILSKDSYADSERTEDISPSAQTGKSTGIDTPRQNGGKMEKGAFDPTAIAGAYVIEREIGGGAMSRTFLVRSVKLGSLWFLKFISSESGSLANEVNILKLLNHVSLPKIIDVYHREEGAYIIQTLIEGIPLDHLGEAKNIVSQHILIDWLEQIAQALNYLHSIKPSPVFHLDLKPGNIMVTHDNRLVLVDFGISRRSGEGSLGAVTASYAAPEQFGGSVPEKHARLIKARFGNLPVGSESWGIDARTDIYSLGILMFELATGRIHVSGNANALKNAVSDELGGIIRKCIEIYPEKRYQSAAELLDDLRRVKGFKIKMARTIMARRLASVGASLSLIVSGGSFAGGYHIYSFESAATLAARPEIVTVSLQQSSEFAVEKLLPGGRSVFVDNAQIRWEFSENNIARIDGSRVSGINVGETIINGRHRRNDIELAVRVVRPLDGMIDISQRYEPGRHVSLFAGTERRAGNDGAIATADFISPESITFAENGTIFISDSGEIRRLSHGIFQTLPMPADYMSAAMIRSFKNELYLLTNPWQDGDKYYYAIVRMGAAPEILYKADALYTAVEDFGFGGDGLLYFIDRNEGLGGVFLRTLNPNDAEDIKTLAQLPPGSSSLAAAGVGPVYIGNADAGAIYVYRGGETQFFAGLEGQRAFIDGPSPRFYSPQRLAYHDGYLYIWDFNTLRRLETANGVAGECVTLAGMASPDYDLALNNTSTPAEDIILPHGRYMDFAVTDSGILLTDPKRGVVWRVE